MRVAPRIVLSPEEEGTLRKFARGRSTPVRLAQRSKIVLMAAEGTENREIARTSARSSWYEQLCEAELVPVGVQDMKEALPPGRIFRLVGL